MIEHNGWFHADAYLMWDEEQQRLYAMGLLDGFYMAPIFEAPSKNKRLVSLETCIEGMKSDQVAAIVAHYIKEHPEHWNWDLKDEAYSALRGACSVR